jgi:hypothetical protein
MATFTDPRAFAQHVGDYAKVIAEANPKATKLAAEACAEIVRKNGARFHIKGRSGKAFELGAKIEGLRISGNTGQAYVIVKADPAGFWKLIEKGAKPHMIRPKRARRGRGRGRGKGQGRVTAAVFASGYEHPVREVHHPGTGPIGHPWEMAMAETQRVAVGIYQKTIVSAMTRAA